MSEPSVKHTIFGPQPPKRPPLREPKKMNLQQQKNQRCQSKKKLVNFQICSVFGPRASTAPFGSVVGLRRNWQKTWNRAQWGTQMWFAFEEIGKKRGTGSSEDPARGWASRKLAKNMEPGSVGNPNVVRLRENWQKTWDRVQWESRMWLGFEKIGKKRGTGPSGDPKCGSASRNLTKKMEPGPVRTPTVVGLRGNWQRNVEPGSGAPQQR